jgi:hypothetical protein
MEEENSEEQNLNSKYLDILKENGAIDGLYEGSRVDGIHPLEPIQLDDPLMDEPFINKDYQFPLGKYKHASLSNKRKACKNMVFGS